MFDWFKKKKALPKPPGIEEMLLESLEKDTWLITQTTSSGHFQLTRNGLILKVATDEKYGFCFYDATVNEQKIKKYESVGRKCWSMVEAKFGVFDLEAMVRKELD